jgi:hypothetical protein
LTIESSHPPKVARAMVGRQKAISRKVFVIDFT